MASRVYAHGHGRTVHLAGFGHLTRCGFPAADKAKRAPLTCTACYLTTEGGELAHQRELARR